jgi:hypothetical protein
MDSAYDVPQIHQVSQQLGRIPLIDKHPRRDEALKTENKRCRIAGYQLAEAVRYKERSTIERVNARLKDEFGGRVVRVHIILICIKQKLIAPLYLTA